MAISDAQCIKACGKSRLNKRIKSKTLDACCCIIMKKLIIDQHQPEQREDIYYVVQEHCHTGHECR